MEKILELTIVKNYHQTRTSITNKAELERKDIWWVAPDGTNLDNVKDDLLAAYSLQK